MHTSIHVFDSYIMNIVAMWPDSWPTAFLAITTLGDPIVTVSIGIVIATYGYRTAKLRLAAAGIAIWLTLLVGSFLKLLFARARPDTEYASNLQILTNSFPSGHASGSMIAYGLLAYLAWSLLPKPWSYIVTGILIATIICIGISRIYLGAHFPTDIIGGWLLGGGVLLSVLFFIRPLK